MKVNFTKLKVRPSLMTEETEEMDLTKEVANALWQVARNAEEADFALKVLHSEGDIEIDGKQAEKITEATNAFAWFAKQPILEQLNKTK